jgi:hypothetical protein
VGAELCAGDFAISFFCCCSHVVSASIKIVAAVAGELIREIFFIICLASHRNGIILEDVAEED